MRWSALRPPARRRRPLWGALLGLVLLLGALDIHPAGEMHSLLEPRGDSEYSPQAAHPGQPLHLEPGTVVSRPACPVCLQRLQLGGLHLEAASALVPPAPRVLLSVGGDVACARGSFSPSGARGPPLS